MATIAANGGLISRPATSLRARRARSFASVAGRTPRRISPEAGRALEMLGHAIDYLADEFSLECMSRQNRPLHGPHPRVAAIELLMECNWAVYSSCPEILTLAERFRSLFRVQRA